MKKVMSRVLAVVICLAMVMESRAVGVWAEETTQAVDEIEIVNEIQATLSVDEINTIHQLEEEVDKISSNKKSKNSSDILEKSIQNAETIAQEVSMTMDKDLIEVDEKEEFSEESFLNDTSSEDVLYFYDRIDELKKSFPEGKYWNHADGADQGMYHVTDIACPSHNNLDTCNSFMGLGWQCNGFARMLYYLLYGVMNIGEGGPLNKDPSQIQVGDVLVYKDSYSPTGEHWCLVIEKNGSVITVGEANSGGNCKIMWSREIDTSDQGFKTAFTDSRRPPNGLNIDFSNHQIIVEEYIKNECKSVEEYSSRCITDAKDKEGACNYRTTVPIWTMPCSNKTDARSLKQSVPNGIEYTITRKIVNSENNTWYEVKDEDGNIGYVFCENVIICYGTKENPKVKLYTAANGKNKIPLREGYYKSADANYVYLRESDAISVIGETVNDYGNLWYKLSNGLWVYSENVKYSRDVISVNGAALIDLGYTIPHGNIGYINFSKYNIPRKFDYGTSLGIEGNISIVPDTFNQVASNSIMPDGAGPEEDNRKVRITIYDRYRSVLQQKIVQMDSTTIDIGSMDSYFSFDTLSPGYYYYCVDVIDGEFSTSVMDVGFTVNGESSTLDYYDDSVNYIIENGVLVRYIGTRTSLNVPDGVVKIGDNCFKNNTSLRYIELPDSLTEIGASAFYGCKSLIGIEIPDNVTSIGNMAFYSCISLGSVVFSKNLNSIGRLAFSNCTSLQSVILPKSIKTIYQGTFSQCKAVERVYIPKSLTIKTYVNDPGVFQGCGNISVIDFEEGITKIPDNIFESCESIKSIVIPETVTEIGSYAFAYCTELEEIQLPSPLKKIGEMSFYKCEKLKSIDFPEHFEEIGRLAFDLCSSLKEVIFPKRIKTVYQGAFSQCTSLEKIFIPKNLTVRTYVNTPGVFKGCTKIQTIEFEEGITKIPDDIFESCESIKSIVIPETVTEIGSYAFAYCTEMEEIQLPSSLKKIGEMSFYKCEKLKSIDFPEHFEEVGRLAFDLCSSLKEVVFPKRIKTVYQGAFSQCTSLEKVFIPKNLTVRTYVNTPGVFKGCDKLQTVEFEEGITTIPAYLFEGCESINSIVIPDTVTKIENSAFYYCTSLQTIYIPDSVAQIGTSAFEGCSSLKSVHLSKALTSIMQYTFARCTSLEVINLPYKLQSIQQYAFNDCDGLTEIILPENVTSLGNYAFKDCDALASFTMGNKVSSMGNYCFDHCDELKNVVLSNALKTIPTGALSNCGQLDDVSIPFSVTSISSKAFANNPKLKSIFIPRSTTSIAVDAFSYPLTIYGIAGTYAETYADNNGHTFVIKEVKATDLEVLPENPVVNEYGQLQLVINVSPADFTDEITCTSSDTNTLSVDNTGLVKGLKEGKASVTVTVGNISKTIDVLVGKYDTERISLITLDPTELQLFTGQSEVITITTDTGSIPEDMNILNSNPSVVSYLYDQGSGLITVKGIDVGNTVITVSFEDIEANAVISVEKTTIKFKDQDGSDMGIDPIDAVYGQKYPTLPIPTKEGAVFAGWFTEAYYAGTMITSDMIFEGINTLYAAWLQDDAKLRVMVSNTFVYTGGKICPDVTVYDGTTILTPKKDYTVAYKNNTNVYEKSEGETGFDPKKAPAITVSGKNNYDSQEVVYFRILSPDIAGDDFSADNISLIATNKDQKVEPSLYWKGKALKKSKDYTFEIFKADDASHNKPLGTSVKDVDDYVVRLKGYGSFTGYRDIDLKVTSAGKSVSKLAVSKIANAPYIGDEIRPEPVIRDGSNVLAKGKHYTLSYDSNIKVGTGYVIVTGNPDNGYIGSKRVSFKITVKKTSSYDISPNKDTGNRITIACDGPVLFVKGGAKPAVTVTFKNSDDTISTLVEGKDYKLSYKNNTAFGGKKSPVAVVSGIGNFKGKKEKEFTISEKALDSVTLLADDKVFKEKANIYTTKVTLTDTDGKSLRAGKDYEKVLAYTYLNDTDVTVNGSTVKREAGSLVDKQDIIPVNTVINVTATAIAGSGYTGSVSGSYRIVGTSILSAKVIIPEQIYTGKPITLSKNEISVSLKGTTLGESDYDIVAYSNNIAKGTAKVTIRGKGNYGGLKTQSFKIKAKGFKWWWRK